MVQCGTTSTLFGGFVSHLSPLFRRRVEELSAHFLFRLEEEVGIIAMQVCDIIIVYPGSVRHITVHAAYESLLQEYLLLVL